MPNAAAPFRLSSYLKPDRIIDLVSTTKPEVLRELVDLLSNAPEVTDPEAFYQAIMEREKVMSTGLGIGLALPHVKIPSVTDFVAALGRKREGVEFDSLDGKPAKIIIMIGAPQRLHREFLRVLAQVAQLFRQEHVREEVLSAESPEKIPEVIRKYEQS